ncbi:hypothetical protein NADFUDRAFT_47839 [Nadsonia fulvescens var. elongata DSM 6958]|uniref:Large ribosomal subunit protein uL23m n=1 Tax=Nadsonia fulvescens var. elongata DSM 6958 TaxID=857566 RepID=A0A1E3PFD4_9ASCO|nr:hypothetical protein NADFUDRAFT_47839 [Nadsonia fulvescens var. elongata DSM 6958]
MLRNFISSTISKLGRGQSRSIFTASTAAPSTNLPIGQIETPDDISEVKPRNFAHKVFLKTRQSRQMGLAPFKMGQKQVFLPWARIILLRPNAKHTPYQAKFIVPRKFNKLDLRDYLYNVYGLPVLNVTTQLLHAKWQRDQPRGPRYRNAQIKKMTVDMEDAFIWPTEPKDMSAWNIEGYKELQKFIEEKSGRTGSDVNKPIRAFDGVLGPYPVAPTPFVPKRLQKQWLNKKKAAENKEDLEVTMNVVKRYVESQK